jgi:hydrogenase maturation protein HypF
MAASILSKTLPIDEISGLLRAGYLSALRHGRVEAEVLVNQLKAPEDLPLTSSAGRVLDAAAALLAICFERTYDGEPAMRLESAATRSNSNVLPLPMEVSYEGRVLTLRTSQMIHDLLQRKKQRERIPDLACAVQLALAKGAGEMAVEIAQRESIRTIGLSGGVAYNDQITRKIEETVTESGLHFLKHRKIPPGDAGISPGQALVAWARSR